MLAIFHQFKADLWSDQERGGKSYNLEMLQLAHHWSLVNWDSGIPAIARTAPGAASDWSSRSRWPLWLVRISARGFSLGEKDNSAGDIEGATAEERLRESKSLIFICQEKKRCWATIIPQFYISTYSLDFQKHSLCMDMLVYISIQY